MSIAPIDWKWPVAVIGEGLFELRSTSEGYAGAAGGDAANIAVMVSRMGVGACLVGRVGNDQLGHQLLRWWSADGVDLHGVTLDTSAPTGIYVNSLDEHGIHHLDYHRRASAGSRLSPVDVASLDSGGARFMVITGITLAISASAAEACEAAFAMADRHHSLKVLVVNHRSVLGGDVGVLQRMAAQAQMVFMSDDEAPLVVPYLADDCEVITTHASKGATVTHHGTHTLCSAPHVRAVDAAGAGDALAGAYLAARSAGVDPSEALHYGVVASALSVRQRGCSASYPWRTEVDEFMSTLGSSPS